MVQIVQIDVVMETEQVRGVEEQHVTLPAWIQSSNSQCLHPKKSYWFSSFKILFPMWNVHKPMKVPKIGGFELKYLVDPPAVSDGIFHTKCYVTVAYIICNLLFSFPQYQHTPEIQSGKQALRYHKKYQLLFKLIHQDKNIPKIQI